MVSSGTAKCALKNRLSGKTIVFGGKPPLRNHVATLLQACGAKIEKEITAKVSYVIAPPSGGKGLEKIVQQLNKKGASITLVENTDALSLLNLTPDDYQVMVTQDCELWDKLLHAAHEDFEISNLTLANARLEGARFENLNNTDFSNSRMSNCLFTGVVKASNFDRTDLTESSLAELHNCSFVEANLSRADLSLELRKNCDFRKANLSDAKMFYGAFVDCDFGDSNLQNVDVNHTDFKNCKLVRANLASAHLRGIDLSNANLTGAVLTAADLTGANLSRANLTNANLQDAILCEAKLTGAIINGADFSGALLNYANLKGVSTDNAKGLTVPKKTVLKAGASLLRLEQAAETLKKVDLTVRVSAGKVPVDLLVARKGSQWHSKACVKLKSNYEGTHKSLSQAMLSVVVEWSAAKLEIDSFRVLTSKTKEDIASLAMGAWCELFGINVPSPKEIKEADEEREQRRRARVSVMLAELRGGAEGVKKWNRRRPEEQKWLELKGLDFSNCDMTGVSLYDLDLADCNFNNTNLKDAKLRKAILDRATLRNACLDNADCGQASMREADLTRCSLDDMSLVGTDLTAAKLIGARLKDTHLTHSVLKGTDFSNAIFNGATVGRASFDEFTKFPEGFEANAMETMKWSGRGRNPLLSAKSKTKTTAGKLDFASFMDSLEDEVNAERFKTAVKMLKTERFQLFAQVLEDTVVGVIKSQTNPELIYSCRLGADGGFACCTQNLNACGGLRGALCKHLLVLVIALCKSSDLDPTKALAWVIAASSLKPKLDKELMSETFIRYKGSESGEVDWRPTETLPEDYYAF
jgi:uncharacterized protein YjbI with pentapeptide repeats